MKLFIDLGNMFCMFWVLNDNWGLVIIDEEWDYKFEYELKDVFGNIFCYCFMVCGKRQLIQLFGYWEKYFFVWDKMNFL